MPTFSKTSRIAMAGIAAGVLAFTSGCAAIGDFFGGKNGISMMSEPAGEPIWNVKAQTAAQQPRIVEDTVVAYVVEDGVLMLKGFALDSGKEKWARPAETGASVNLPLTLALDSTGAPMVANFTTPQLNPVGDGKNYWFNPIEVISTGTGELRATTPQQWWAAGSTGECAEANAFCIIGMSPSSAGAVIPLSVNDAGEFLPVPYPQLDDLKVARGEANGNTSVVIGETSEGVPTAWLLNDESAAWSIPLTELGLTKFTTEQMRGGYDDTSLSAHFIPEENVVLVDATYSPSSGITQSHSATVTALDSATGEKLWTKAADLCLRGTSLICEGEVTATEKESGLVYTPGDYTFSMVNPRTGEAKWSVSETDLPMYDQKKAWLVPGGSAYVLNTETPKLLNLKSGEVSDLTPEQSFGCYGEGHTFEHHRSSRPDLPLVSDTQNVTATACTVEGIETDPATFSQGVVASISQKPFHADKNWDVFAKQIRVIATADGIYAYEF